MVAKRSCMVGSRRIAWSALLALMFWSAGSALAQTPLVGEPAPDFSLRGSDGSSHSLAAHRGKRAVVLAWFPKAFTPG